MTLSLPESTANGRARAAALEQLGVDDVAPTSLVEFVSRGRCLIIGEEAAALAAARALPDPLTVTVLVPSTAVPTVATEGNTRIVRGGRPLIRGALGDFSVSLVTDGVQRDLGPMLSPPVQRFDLIVDLGDEPLLRQAMLPLGYYAPRGDAAALARTLEGLPEMVGEFEKPRYFEYDAEICAHGRSGKRGCTRCIDACPAEAIVSFGEQVQVNPYLCQGGGICATACPTGAITYAYPRAADLLAGIRGMLRTYRDQGGRHPVVLFHDASGARLLAEELSEAMPEQVLPVAVEEIGSIGFDAWFVTLAYGADRVLLLTTDGTPAQVIEAAQQQLVTARALLAGMGYDEGSVRFVNADQPAEALAALTHPPFEHVRRPGGFDAPDDKRGRLRLAIEHLRSQAPAPKRSIALEPGAPFGEVRVDVKACTLCMACVSACPTHALLDGRGLPQLNFREWNCVQCGLCERTCPEDAITLNARFLFDIDAREKPRALHAEEPFCCVVCGKPFATRSMLEVMNRKLAGHWMFQNEDARRRLQMCEDCRVRDLFGGKAGQPPRRS
jgi:ferredoxin